MKLIVKEYLSIMRERDELDALLYDLLSLAGFQLCSIPHTGERQSGVDVAATKDGILYLFVIKQKDIDRNAWDSNQNSVRQSINEILDDYIPH